METAAGKICMISIGTALTLLAAGSVLSQTPEANLENPVLTNQNQFVKPGNSLYEVNDLNEVNSIIRSATEEDLRREVVLYKYSVEMLRPQNNIQPEKPLDVVSSFRSNIRFGGFWDKYAILNFTPQIFVKPFEFLSIYASHNRSYFVPMDKIKENVKGFAIEGAAIMAAETSFRFLNPGQGILGKALNFVVKNLIITYMTQVIMKDKNNGVVDFNNYYYSFSLRF